MCQGKGLRYVRAQFALAIPFPELPEALRELARLAPREVAPEHADNRGALEQREVEGQARNVAGGEAHHQQAPAPGNGAERRLAVRAADRVIDHVCAFAAGEALHLLAQVLAGVIDGRIRAMLAAHSELVVAPGAGYHARTKRLAEFDRRQSHAD